MRFSIWPSSAQPWDDIETITRHCEQTGWDGVYFADHFMPNDPAGHQVRDGATLECWSVLSALAAAVPRIELAPLVTSVTYRHPAVLANIAAAVDQISYGRLTLGVGAGWQLNEHAAYGLELGTVKERMNRFEEAVAVLRSLLDEPRTSFSGQFFELRDAPNQPAPVQRRLPLLIGGGGEKRTLRITARYADHWNCWSNPEILAHKLSVLRAHCEDLGRDPAEIRVSTQAVWFLSDNPDFVRQQREKPRKQPVLAGSVDEITDTIGRYAEAGLDEMIVPDVTLGSMKEKQDTCDAIIERIAPQFR